MSSLDKAVQTQIDNIQKKTGRSLAEISSIVNQSGLTKHGEILELLKKTLNLGHGDANALAHAILKSDGTRAADGKSLQTVLDEIYTGPKAGFRRIHDALMEQINQFGEFGTVPKKGYVSLRRNKQFAMIGPKTNTRFEVGINAKDFSTSNRLLEQPSGSMCNYIINLTDVKEVDTELVSWIKSAYDQAG